MKWDDPAAFVLTAYESPGFQQKKLDKYAAMASRLHPRVNDWLCAAPILAVALADQRYYQGLYDLACARGKVVDALRICHIPTPMRKQRADEADHWHKLKTWRSVFPELPESEIAQMVAQIASANARTEWTNKLTLAMKKRPAGTDFSAYAQWAVRLCATHDRSTVHQITDYMQRNEFDLSWTVGQFQRAHRRWVEQMRAEWALRREMATIAPTEHGGGRRARLEKILDEVISFAPFPSEWGNSLGSATALNTARKLMEEGANMRHCVGSQQFVSAMRKRRALYFHIEAGQERSTLEIQRVGRRFLIGQHCGPCNQRPSAALQTIASALLQDGLKAERDVEDVTNG